MIYKLHLSKGGDYKHNAKMPFRFFKCFRVECPEVGVNLLRACKQVYVEAVQYVYHERLWILGELPRFKNYSKILFDSGSQVNAVFDDTAYFVNTPSKTLARVGRLELWIPEDWSNKILLPTIGKMQNLKQLHIGREWCRCQNTTRFRGDHIDWFVSLLRQIPRGVQYWSLEYRQVHDRPSTHDFSCLWDYEFIRKFNADAARNYSVQR